MNTLPADAPVQAIQAWMQLSSMKQGESKQQAEINDQKKKAQEAIENYLRQARQKWIPIGGKYLVLETKEKLPSVDAEFIAKAYYFFHTQEAERIQSMSVLERANLFTTQYIPQLQKRMAEKVEKLVVKKSKPTSVMLEELHQMSSGML